MTTSPARALVEMVEIISLWENGGAGDGDADGEGRHLQGAEQLHAALEPFSLPGGYVNFLGPETPDQVAHSYGANTERLLAVKCAVDPDSVFPAHRSPVTSAVPRRRLSELPPWTSRRRRDQGGGIVSESPGSGSAEESGRSPERGWVGPLCVLVVGTFMSVLDTSIVNVAVLTIQLELSAAPDDIEWKRPSRARPACCRSTEG